MHTYVDSSLLILHSKLCHNEANSGGTLYLMKTAVAYLLAAPLSTTEQKKSGGVIMASAMSAVSITGSNFTHSTAAV